MALARLSPFVTGTIRLEYALSLSGGLSIKHNKQIATRNHFSVVWKVVVTLLGGCGAPWNTLINTQAILSRSAHQTTALCVHGNSTCLPVSGGLTEIHTAASLCTVSATQQMAGGIIALFCTGGCNGACAYTLQEAWQKQGHSLSHSQGGSFAGSDQLEDLLPSVQVGEGR